MSAARITPRNPDFGLSAELPRFWHGHGIFISHYLDAQSILFPAGEQFFIDSVLHYRRELPDGPLLDAVKNFCAQESIHRQKHQEYNDILARRGYDATGLERSFSLFMEGLRRRTHPLSRLAMTTAMEHFTAISALRTLKDRETMDGAHPAYAWLWRWHALEELEHKAVAFDVYAAVGGRYPRRVLWFLAASAIFLFFTSRYMLHFLRRDGVLFHPGVWLEGFHRLFIRPGFLTRIIPSYAAFLRPSFHPHDIEDEHLLEAWRSYAEHGPRQAPGRGLR